MDTRTSGWFSCVQTTPLRSSTERESGSSSEKMLSRISRNNDSRPTDLLFLWTSICGPSWRKDHTSQIWWIISDGDAWPDNWLLVHSGKYWDIATWQHRLEQFWQGLQQTWLAKQRRVIKLGLGHAPVSKMMLLWKKQEHSRCPLCDHDNEDVSHMLVCRHPSACTAWKQALIGFDKQLTDLCTEPEMHKAIM